MAIKDKLITLESLKVAYDANREAIDTLTKELKNQGSSENGNNADVTSIKTVLGNIMTILKAQVEDENGTPQGYNTDVSGLVIQNDTLIASMGSSGGGEEKPDTPVTPEKTLSSISAVYSGGNVAVGTAVTDLTGIVVTAHYSDGTSEPVTGYTLSGTIAEGANTVTVSYGGKTTTFNVTGVAVAMTEQFSSSNVIMEWYSDGGSTTATDCPGRDYLGILVSDDVFTEDTIVKITLAASTKVFNCYNVGCFDYASDKTFNTGDSVYYAVHLGDNAYANSGVTHELEYTVKAGYHLIVTAYNTFGTTTTASVEVV